jgi:hypothetical protein
MEVSQGGLSGAKKDQVKEASQGGPSREQVESSK